MAASRVFGGGWRKERAKLSRTAIDMERMMTTRLTAIFALILAIFTGCKFAELPAIEDDGAVGDGPTARFTLTVTVEGPGTVESNPPGIVCPGACEATYSEGDTVELTAAASTDAAFVGYSGACTGASTTCPVQMSMDRTLTASFQALACTPNTVTCSQQVLNQCDANGVSHPSVCELGCHPNGTRCYDLLPSNSGIATCLDDAAVEADVAIPDGATINTDSGAIALAGGGTLAVPSTSISAPSGGVAVRCFRGNNVTVGNVTIVGSAAWALAANGTVSVTGRVAVDARGYNTPGPGHLSAYIGCNGGNSTNGGGLLQAGGGGGGGFGTLGGAGGGGGNGAMGGIAGPANGTQDLVPLRGGCSGGGLTWGGGAATRFLNAGGALQIVSRKSITLSANGGFSANGWGGGWDGIGSTATTNHGGGSGGGILLEAPTVTVPAQAFLVANGGSGGSNVSGNPGLVSVAPALGPTGDATFAAAGRGGSQTTDPFPGATHGTNMGGGGGGAVGRIRVNVYNAFAPDASAVISPAPSTGSPGRR